MSTSPAGRGWRASSNRASSAPVCRRGTAATAMPRAASSAAVASPTAATRLPRQASPPRLCAAMRSSRCVTALADGNTTHSIRSHRASAPSTSVHDSGGPMATTGQSTGTAPRAASSACREAARASSRVITMVRPARGPPAADISAPARSTRRWHRATAGSRL